MEIDGKAVHARYESMLDAMVDRFLARKLPQDFAPDAGIAFNPGHITPSSPLWPMGTNLLTGPQAKQMFRECVPPTCFGLDDCSSQALSSCEFADRCGG